MRVALVAVLLLSGCSGSGFWRYEKDSFTFPWQNPNGPVSGSENYVRSRYGMKTGPSPQILTESGDIWPGPPAVVPTLKDLQKQQLAEINNSGGVPGQGLAPLPTLPALPGYEISNQEPGNPAPSILFTGGVVGVGGRHVSTAYGVAGSNSPNTPPAPAASGNIIVPNGNGTSTVISPTGKVTTIPSPPSGK
jgi:hypothetical protein